MTYGVIVKDIPIHRQAFTIEQKSHINGPTSRPFLRACIVYWTIPIFNHTPLWMTINGVKGEGRRHNKCLSSYLYCPRGRGYFFCNDYHP